MKKKAIVLGLLIIGFCNCMMAEEEKPVFDDAIKPVHIEELAYPPLARMANIQGIVVVRAKLDVEGKVEESVALSGPKVLIPECIANSKKWKFQPISDNRVIIIYDFRLEGLCYFHSPCASQFSFRPPNVATITSGFQVVDHYPNPAK